MRRHFIDSQSGVFLKGFPWFVAALFFCGTSFAQLHFDWARTYRVNPSKTNQAWKILLASDGVIVGGSSVSATGDADYVLIKYKANGEEAWVRRYNGGTGREDVMRDMKGDRKGNVFVTGTSDTVKFNAAGNFVWAQPFGGRAVVANETYVYVTGFSGSDFATVQLENEIEGRANWVRMFNGAFHDMDWSEALALTESGDVIVGGSETVWRSLRNQIIISQYRFFKYDSSGTEIWQTPTGGGSGVSTLYGIRSLLVDSSGYIRFFGRLDANSNVAGSLNSDGTSFAVPEAHLYFPGQMALCSDGDMVVVGCGWTQGSTTDSSNVAKIERYRRNGELVWERGYRAGGYANAWARGVAVSTKGQVYAAGLTPRTGEDLDVFVVGYEADGTQFALGLYDGANHLQDLGNDMVIDNRGGIYVTGFSTTPEGGQEFLTLKYSMLPKIEVKSGGEMHLEFLATAGQPYAIEGTTDFLSWQSLMTNTADASGLVRFEDTNAVTIPIRFYRGKQP